MGNLNQWLTRRRLRKEAREILHHALHVRSMREDLMRPEELRRLQEAEAGLRAATKAGAAGELERKGKALLDCLHAVTPERTLPGVRENLEIIVVAIAVAMAFRTYFFQPFKIPTGSMQPTLYGIQVQPDVPRTRFDQFPLKPFKWFLTGEWYSEIKAKTDGYVAADPMLGKRNTTDLTFYVGDKLHSVPSLEGLRVRPGVAVAKGQVLWAGIHTAGDHVLVNKIAWNFRKPRRGDIMVFNTDHIPTLPENTHYIKRLSGCPGETLSIDPPNLIVDGHVVREPVSIARIADQSPGYAGYQLVDPRALGSQDCVLRTKDDRITLGPDEYFALGDNTGNSRDSRYWGPVKQANLVGPAALVYWPFSTRWGLAK